MGKAKPNRPLKQTSKSIDSYNIALQTRNFEIQLFWQRSNYFLVLNTAIITGIAIKLNSTDPIAAIFIAFGLFVSLLWFRVNLGSKFWQSRWEQCLYDIEKRISPNANLFSATDEQIKADVKKSMQIAGGRNWWRRYIDRKALLRPSVSRQMILLSVGFICLYFAFSVIWIIKILTNSTV